jgi:hypothetical protein
VIDILTREVQLIMRQVGTPVLANIMPDHVIASTWGCRSIGRLEARRQIFFVRRFVVRRAAPRSASRWVAAAWKR